MEQLNKILQTFKADMDDAEQTTVVELFSSKLVRLEGAIAAVYASAGTPEEYARDQIEFAVRCGAGDNSLLDSEELKQYYRLKQGMFSALGFMYNQRVNEDLTELAWEAFQIANPGGDRALFDGVRTGNREALAALGELQRAQMPA